MEEIVDIVNDSDAVIGQSTKANAHLEGLLHRCSVAVIVDSQDNWLLVRQAASRQDPGQFVCPVGGHVSAGETYESALQREALEEVGYRDIKYKFVGSRIFNRDVLNRKENHYFTMFEIYSDDEPILNAESVSYRKFSRPELRQLIKSQPQMFGAPFLFLINELYPEIA